MKHLRLPLLILTLVLILSTVSCGRTDEPRTKTYYEYFDTVSHVRSYAGESEAVFSERADAVEALLKKYHRLLDIYHEYDGMNNLATVNKSAGLSPVEVERELIDLLLYAKEVYTLTNGEVNVAMGATLSLWHNARERATNAPESAAIPTDAELSAAAEHISIDSIIIDETASTVYISDPHASIDVGAIGKGYATERAAELLASLGADSYVLDIGGNLRAVGAKPDGSGWVTGITSPDRSASEPFATRLILSDTSCVTSGDYERYFTVDGKAYHHIIDKDTHRPAEYFSSVSVITRDSALADALSTALFCMSYEDGRALCENIGGVEVIWIKKDGTLLSTDGINAISAK